jgi:hypothetical protein
MMNWNRSQAFFVIVIIEIKHLYTWFMAMEGIEKNANTSIDYCSVKSIII